jgi:peptidoglycan/xylan/chitin deacetylase (PgdA/CDA1 family)
MNVIIVAHTEFGRVVDKRCVFVKDPVGVVEGVPNLLRVTDKYGAKVTFAVCPEVVPFFDPTSECEVGLHIHPGWEEFKRDGMSWYVGDLWLRNHFQPHCNSTLLREYPYQAQYQLIAAGKERLKERLGIVPQTFVAGRWSVNNQTIRALCENGFTHDCSCFTTHKEEHFDWSKINRFAKPYTPMAHDYQMAGGVPLLIIPISQLFKGGNVNPESAVTYPMSWFKLAFQEYYRKKSPVFHICLHSPIMTDPYFVDFFDRYLEYIAKHKGIEFKFVREI